MTSYRKQKSYAKYLKLRRVTLLLFTNLIVSLLTVFLLSQLGIETVLLFEQRRCL